MAVQQASDFNHMYCTQIKRVRPGSTAALLRETQAEKVQLGEKTGRRSEKKRGRK